MNQRNNLSLLLVFLFLLFSCSKTQNIKFVETGFKTPPQSSKVHTWWHWMDGNITREGITKDLEAMHSQGITEATILNVSLLNDRDVGVPKVRFASAAWYDMFAWTLVEAKRLNMAIGVHNCDGFSSSGGPWITPEKSMKQFVWTKTIVKGGQNVKIKLVQPIALHNFYKDVAVVAYRTKDTQSAFLGSKPVISLNDTTDASVLTDGNPISGIPVHKGSFLLVAMDKPLTFNRLILHPHCIYPWGNFDNNESSYTLQVSTDKKNFKTIKTFTVKGINKAWEIKVPTTTSRYARLLINDVRRYLPFEISEFELLHDGETPLYYSSVSNLLGKTVAVKATCGQINTIDSNTDSQLSIITTDDIISLKGKMDDQGYLNWDAPEGDWVILRFGYTTTGAINSPATKEGHGLECDKMDSTALDIHFNNFPAKLIEKAGPYTGNTFKFLLIDSWECGYQNWTEKFPDEFEKRRGYSLLNYLPALCGETVGSAEETNAVLYDFRKTIADLIEQNYYGHFSRLAHQNKLEMHAEIIYGDATYPPLDIMKSTRYADMPMYEYWVSTFDDRTSLTYGPSTWPELSLPVSAATGYNKQVVGAESYTGFAHYSETPGAIKPFGDRAYCMGVNQFILHSYVHQPTEVRPGLTLGQYGSHFNRHNPTWSYLSEWFNYQSRIQSVLQQGATTQDVLYFLGDQLPQYYAFNNSNTLPSGYQVNTCNFDILKNRVKMVDGKLRLNGTIDYSLLSLSPYPYMNLETLRRIEELVKEGTVVYGPKPIHPLSNTDLSPENLKTFKELADRIWGKENGISVIENTYGKGKVFWGIPITEAIKKIGLMPDFSTNRKEDKSFLFIHKKVGDTDVYFVANQKDSCLTRECLFRITDKTPELWNPEEGSQTQLAVFRYESGQTRIPVSFKPYESKLFVFKSGIPADYITLVECDGKQIFPSSDITANIPLVSVENGTHTVEPIKTANYTFTTNSRKSFSGHFEQNEETMISDFKGSIRFEAPYKDDIADIEITSLQPLTESTNPDIRYFSGEAHYTLSFNTPKGFKSTDGKILLDIGGFGSVARVSLNGEQLGDLWGSGMRLDITGLLKITGENELKVTVASVYRNRLIGDLVQYGKIKNLWTTSPVEHFLTKDSLIKQPGLTGPLKLVKTKPQLLLLR